MGQLYFLIGLPRSGKSSLASRWVFNEINIENGSFQPSDSACVDNPRVVVCADQIRLAMGHRWNGVVEPHVAAVRDTMIRTLLQDHDVLVDGTHTTSNSIFNLLLIYPQASWCFVDTAPDECIKRAIATNQEDLRVVINRMYDNLRMLQSQWDDIEGAVENLRIKAETNKKSYERIV